MTKSVGMHEAKTHLSRLVDLVAAGEEVAITRRGVVVARIVAPRAPTSGRLFGIDDGLIEIGEDFDAPLPADVQQAFEGAADEDELLGAPPARS